MLVCMKEKEKEKWRDKEKTHMYFRSRWEAITERKLQKDKQINSVNQTIYVSTFNLGIVIIKGQ